jgi:hypothetical protein
MEPKSFLRHLNVLANSAIIASLAILLSQCATERRMAPPPVSADEAAPSSSYAVKRGTTDRPGLGTKLGEKLTEDTVATKFYRKAANSPDAVATFHYNDKEGARLMAEFYGRATYREGDFELVPGKLKVSVEANTWSSGSTFGYYSAGGKNFVVEGPESEYGVVTPGVRAPKYFVVGVPGSDYVMKFKNLTRTRMQVVVSVDGLDVLDGQPASIKKPGYVIPANSSIHIRGMRVGGQLRSFVFGTVPESRASKSFGEKGARNIGVIGVASYEEDEAARRRVRVEENYVREDARAFGN